MVEWSTDRYGLPLTTNPDAAAAFRHGIDTVLRCDTGGRSCLERAVLEDPGFALGQATLAVLEDSGGAPVRARRRLREATALATREGVTDRERSAVAAFAAVVAGGPARAAALLSGHLTAHPLDAFALSVAVPTVAFSGVTETCEQVWPLVEQCAPHYGGDWWFTSLLSFVEEERGHYDTAFTLAEQALAVEPRSGHAVHARTHVHYETGDHVAGLDWLDGWIADRPAEAVLAGHVNWHAALHELCLGDLDAVRRRFDTTLRPPALTGVRAMVDGGSLLFRAGIRGGWPGDLPVTELVAAAGATLRTPCSPFVGLHAALLLTLAGDTAGLRALSVRCRTGGGSWTRSLLPVVEGLLAFADQRWAAAAGHLAAALPELPCLGGSLAQREVVEETYLRALLSAGRLEQARALVRHRHHADRVLHWVPGELADLSAPGDGPGVAPAPR